MVYDRYSVALLDNVVSILEHDVWKVLRYGTTVNMHDQPEQFLSIYKTYPVRVPWLRFSLVFQENINTL